MERGQTSSINRSHPRHKDKIGSYRIINNVRIPSEMLQESLQNQCSDNAEGLALICIQDTTEYNYQRHAERIQPGALGLVGNNSDIGFFAHVMLCFEAESCLPLGIPNVHLWSRNPNKKNKTERGYQNLPIEQKESYRWIEPAESTKERMQHAKHLTFISDRESDIYQLWSRIPDIKTDLIIRARKDRALYDKPVTAFKFIEKQEIIGSYKIQLKEDKRKNRSKRQVKLNVKIAEVKIKKPHSVKEDKESAPDYINSMQLKLKKILQPLKRKNRQYIGYYLPLMRSEVWSKPGRLSNGTASDGR